MQYQGYGDATENPPPIDERKPKPKAVGKQKTAQAVWTPWKDRIRSHKDAVLFVTICLGPAGLDAPEGMERPRRPSITPDVPCLLSASADGTMRIFELSRSGSQPESRQKLRLQPPPDGLPRRGLPGRPAARGHGSITNFAYQGRVLDAPECNSKVSIIYGAYESGRIAGWNTVNGQLVVDLDGHTAAVANMRCCIGAEGSDSTKPCIVSASLDGTLRVWRGAEEATIVAAAASAGIPTEEMGITVDQDENPAETVSRIHNMVEKVFDPLKENRFKGTEEKKALSTVAMFAKQFGGTAKMVSDLEAALAKSFPQRSGADIHVMLEMEDLMAAAIEDLEGKQEAYDAKLLEGDDEGPRCIFVLDFGARNPVSDFVLLPDQKLIASSWDGRLRSVDMNRRVCNNIVEVRSGYRLTSVCTRNKGDPGADDVYVGMEDGSIYAWNMAHDAAAPSNEIFNWKAHQAMVTQLAFTDYVGKHSGAQKKWLVSASEDQTVCLWAPEDGTLLKEFYGHTGGVLVTCYAGQDRLLWSGSRDHSLRSWDFEEVEAQTREQQGMEESDKESRQFRIQQMKTQASKKTTKKSKKGEGSGKSGKSKSPERKKSPGKTKRNKG